MLIFLANIPKNTTKRDIIDFLNPVIKNGLFPKKGIIESLEILIYEDSNSTTSPHFGLVRIEPDSAANRAIKKLNKTPLKGKRITVREYCVRSWRNDPRAKTQNLWGNFQNRRRGERRQNKLMLLTTDSEQISIIGNKSFHRTL